MHGTFMTNNSEAAPLHTSTYSDCIDAAMVCCSQAREAATAGRFGAANGLLQTALTLHQRAETEAGSGQSEVLVQRFDKLVDALCFCAQIIEVESVAHRERALPKVGAIV